ncbi:alpha/beta fold hydrolase [Haloplanus aerogenes]|uniref:Alpha/beta hydrolase n=1 Tax=Haloplanus aerogenes TaxID=660522 RepID=A0A3M0DW50_9EURY|nr:alpha/beta hydrolase [Haloplanus aerogenes]AZH24628.1 alpha/beta hydrolase [Haloplanus aerogenes]RMB23716.1 pimeloyl-ACP methyl ester carboxylesterase [Haloplanus aerogenes]
MRTRTVTGGDGVEIHVEERGPADAHPLLLIHGFSQSRLAWTPQYDSALTDDYRLVAMDLRGHGASGTPSDPDAYRDSTLWADDVRAVIEGLNLDAPTLVGWSYGGLVVSDYLATHGGDAVSGIVLVGAITEKGTDDADRFAGDEFVALDSGFRSTDVEESVDTLAQFVRLCVEESLDDADFYRALGYNVAVPPFVRAAMQDRAVEHETALAGVETPILLVHGEDDPVVRSDAAAKHADLFPNAELELYADVGHSPFFEAPDRFEADLRAFLG